MKYDYEAINDLLHPVIKGILIGSARTEKLAMIVDTGFEGSLLIPSGLYRELGFLKYEHPVSEFPMLETVAGMVIKIRSAPAKLSINDHKMDVDVWTMPDCNEILLGLGVLNEIILKLNGPEKIIEIMDFKFGVKKKAKKIGSIKTNI